MIGARCLGSLAILLVATSAVAGSEQAEARDLFEQGVALAKQERWSAALEKFNASRSLVERPSTLFNIGTTLMRLNQPTAAARAFERFLDTSAKPERRAAAEKYLRDARAQVVLLELEVEPREARLTIDGERVEANGPVHRLSVDPGPRVVAISAEGFEDLRETLELTPGSQVKRAFALARAEVPKVVQARPPPLAPIVETEPVESDSIFTSPWFWIVAGAIVVGAAVGVGVAVGTGGTEEPYGGTGGGVIEP